MERIRLAQSRLWERRSGALYDLARALMTFTADGAPFSPATLTDSSFLEAYRRETAAPPPAAGEDASLAPRASACSLLDRAALCRIFSSQIGIDTDFEEQAPLTRLLGTLLPSEEEDEDEASFDEREGNRVSYFRSSYSDSAYLRFSEVVPDLRADYASSFAAVCEDVYYDRADFCILPLENSTDGTLLGFRNMILRHGLKIVATVDVSSGESQSTRFALLKKRLIALPFAEGKPQKGLRKQRFLRLSVQPDTLPVSSLLEAAEIFGLSLYKIDTVPVSYGEGRFVYDITLTKREACQTQLGAFFAFLTLEAPDFEVIGLYTHFSYIK